MFISRKIFFPTTMKKRRNSTFGEKQICFFTIVQHMPKVLLNKKVVWPDHNKGKVKENSYFI